MLNKKIISGLLACTFTFGICAFSPMMAKGDDSILKYSIQSESKGTVDLAIANEGRIIKMLQKSGQIPKGATEDQIQAIYKNYLKGMSNDYNSNPSKMTAEEKTEFNKIRSSIMAKNVTKKTSKFQAATPRTWDGKVKKDKILVLLQDFQDLKYGKITPDESDMYYSDPASYNQQHFQDMLFGSNGYVLPDGKKSMSVKQYYEQQSGGSYTIDGTVLGWYTSAREAAYYGADSATSHNIRAKNFVYEALKTSALQSGVNLADYDTEDPYDIDGDNDINEPDGIIDHLMVVHAGVGQEAGGGVLGDDSIWSHSSALSTGPVIIPGATSNSTNFGGKLTAYKYTIMPEDGASGVFAHEFGHDLGLPDDYDTEYTGKGEPISSWSIMANGSWAGAVPGTEPTGFNPDAKAYFQKTYGGNWSHGTEIDLNNIPNKGIKLVLDQASKKGSNNDFVKINLPDKSTKINVPTSGAKEYYSNKGDDLDTYMTANVDLTGKTSATLNFKTWYQIEPDYDYAYVEVKAEGENWVYVPGNITTTTDPNKANLGNGITGISNGWVDATFDLSAFAGKKITLAVEYVTDSGLTMQGFYMDDVNVIADGNPVLTDNVEGTPKFDLTGGFSVSDGNMYTKQYYMVEWRSQNGSDSGLAHINKLGNIMSYSPGMVVWYVDNSYDDNWVGVHPGYGRIGVVDADQRLNMWHFLDGATPDMVGSTQYQINDAAFCQKDSQPVFLDFSAAYGRTLTDNATSAINEFNDANSYINPLIPDAGKILPTFGLKIVVNGQAKDYSSGTIMIKK